MQNRNRFEKLVAIEPIKLTLQWEAKLKDYAKNVTLYQDLPSGNAEIIRRMEDADGVLVSYTTTIDKEALLACKNLKYVGMCCSLYSPESANVDIRAANDLDIQVLGVRDYGDEGVAEYVVSELVRLLHGFGPNRWKDVPMELTGLNIGILGMGATGTIIARALRFFGANIYYYSRTRKCDLEKSEGYQYMELHSLLGKIDILCTCLNKNVVLLGDQEFQLFGNGKIIINTSIAPSHKISALKNWLQEPTNYMLCDMNSGIDEDGRLRGLPNVICVGQASGMTALAQERLGEKVIHNIASYLGR